MNRIIFRSALFFAMLVVGAGFLGPSAVEGSRTTVERRLQPARFVVEAGFSRLFENVNTGTTASCRAE